MTPDTCLAELRRTAPLVHCITNFVAMNVSANVVLAAGASPAMIHAEQEVADFVPVASALTINIGTLSEPWLSAMLRAADAAHESQTPWAFDPVAHFATPYRRAAAQSLLAKTPTIIRGNASEIIALEGGSESGKGVDAGDSVASAQSSAVALARQASCVVAVTGAEDFVTDGVRNACVAGGSDFMPKVTALGCSLTALMGGYAAVAPPFEAALAALVHFAEAGARAEAQASGPGSFAVHFLDALAAVHPEDMDQERIKCD